MASASVLTAGVGYVFWWLAVRNFTPEAVGFAAATTSAMTLLGTLGVLGLGTLVIAELGRRPGGDWRLVSWTMAAAALPGLVLGLAFAATRAVVRARARGPGIAARDGHVCLWRGAYLVRHRARSSIRRLAPRRVAAVAQCPLRCEPVGRARVGCRGAPDGRRSGDLRRLGVRERSVAGPIGPPRRGAARIRCAQAPDGLASHGSTRARCRRPPRPEREPSVSRTVAADRRHGAALGDTYGVLLLSLDARRRRLSGLERAQHGAVCGGRARAERAHSARSLYLCHGRERRSAGHAHGAGQRRRHPGPALRRQLSRPGGPDTYASWSPRPFRSWSSTTTWPWHAFVAVHWRRRDSSYPAACCKSGSRCSAPAWAVLPDSAWAGSSASFCKPQ